MSVTLPTFTGNQNVLDQLNAAMALIQAAINNATGADLQAASVPVSALAKGRHWITPTWGALPFTLGGAGARTTMSGLILPNVDGAVNAGFKYLGCSVMSYTANASAGRFVKVYEDAVLKQTLDLSGVAFNLVPTIFGFGDATLPAPVTTTSGKKWTLDYGDGAAATLTGLQITPFFSMPLVGT